MSNSFSVSSSLPYRIRMDKSAVWKRLNIGETVSHKDPFLLISVILMVTLFVQASMSMLNSAVFQDQD